MEGEKSKTIEYRILSKSLREALDNEEQALLCEWLAADERHVGYYQSMVRHRAAMGCGGGISHEERTAHAFRKFQQTCLLKKGRARMSYRVGWIVGTAAVLLIALGVGLHHRKASSVTVKAGTYMALLTTTHGENVTLGKKAQEVRLTGVSHLIQDDMMLDYSQVEAAEENHTLTVPRGREFRMRLHDGTVVDINSQSTLTYPSGMSKRERRVKLTGEAYFDVAQDASRPFIVEVGGMQIHVTGTAFNVRAYQDEAMVSTTLERGSVIVSAGAQTLSLSPGQQACLTHDGSLVKAEVDTELYTAWRKGYFVFENTPLKNVLGALSRWYDVDVSFEEASLENVRIDGMLNRGSDLNELLESIEKLDFVRFDIRPNRVLVKKARG